MVILGIVFSYLLIINIVTFLAFGIDKRKAKKDKWRISESTLIIMMLIGGTFGGYFGMEKFHHKTQKRKFKIFRTLSFLTFLIIVFFAFKYGIGF
ncbi:DUF1294 domain-containing protein [Mollicutes bacterium LVI A0039]|nr:DUF1294 domain-containing protein [Mollicutes bacterium LVI A0039]